MKKSKKALKIVVMIAITFSFLAFGYVINNDKNTDHEIIINCPDPHNPLCGDS